MKVKELIDLLKNKDPEAIVGIEETEYGYFYPINLAIEGWVNKQGYVTFMQSTAKKLKDPIKVIVLEG